MATDFPEDRATILIVDDTPDYIAMMSGFLKASFRVKAATNGPRRSQLRKQSRIRN